MEEKYFQISSNHKEAIKEDIKAFLRGKPNILFAYLHGSFLKADRFRDIDIAVYLSTVGPSSIETELQLETELSRVIRKYPVEVRILNHAPLSFRYNVIKEGSPIVVVDDGLCCQFVEETLRDYFDFAPFRKMYLKEALSSGI